MMFSDAGYGLLMVIGTGLAIKLFKPDKEMRNTLKLFQYCGVSTFSGDLFLQASSEMPPQPFTTTLRVQTLRWSKSSRGRQLTRKGRTYADDYFNSIRPCTHSCRYGLQILCLPQAEDYGGAFFDTGLWMLMLIGFAVLAAGMAFGQTLVYVGAGIAIFCAIGLVLTQGRNKKGFGKVIGGLASLYDITGYISDLLSYSRLLALGLTTGVMAQVFNMLSTMFGKSWFGIILLIIVFIIGHAINIGLNALGSYVHTMRLQYVEMFGKFYEGGGKQFKPFKLNSKYIKIQEDKSK